MGLYDIITNTKSLDKAWDKVRRKRAVAGTDGVTSEEFQIQRKEMIAQLQDELKEECYTPHPAKMVTINRDSKERMVSILCVRDKIVQQAICFELNKIFEDTFSDSAYAYRTQYSALQAIEKVENWIKHDGAMYFLKTDILKFFDNMLIERTIKLLQRRIHDEKVLNLINVCLHMKNIDSYGIIHEKTIGVYQGSLLAPVLSNIYLTDFDRWLERIEKRYIRYSDDILVFGNDKSVLEELLGRMSAFLEKQGLKLNENKTFIGKLEEGFIFLGYKFNNEGKAVPLKATNHLEERLEEQWLKNSTLSLGEKIKKSTEIIGGWEQYYKGVQIPGSIYEYIVALVTSPTGKRSNLEKIRFNYDNIHKDIMEYMATYWHTRGDLQSELKEYEQYYQVLQYDADKFNNMSDIVIKELVEQYKLAIINESDTDFTEIMQIYTDAHCYNKAKQILEWVQMREKKDFQIPETSNANMQWHGTKLSDTEMTQYIELFVGREDIYKQAEVLQNGKIIYELVKQPLMVKQLKEHLSGVHTLATFLQRNNNTVKYMVFDIDISKKVLMESSGDSALQDEYQHLALEKAVEIQKICRQSGLTTYIEYSGYKGYHVWLFFDEWIAVRYVNLLQDVILARLSNGDIRIQVECFPNKTRIRDDKIRQGVKLPWGRHFLSGEYTYFLSEDLTFWENQKEMLNGVARFSVSEIKRIIAVNTGQKMQPVQKKEISLEEFGELPESIKTVLLHCGLMQYLCEKAKNTGYLPHFERLTVLYVFGHLGEEGKEFVHKVMEYTLNYQYNVTERYIKRLPDKPVSCIKLREQYKQVTAETGCNCNFKRTPGCYPSPVLHVIRDASHVPEGVTVPASRNVSQKEEKKISKELNIHKRAEEIVNKMIALRKQERGIRRAISKQEIELGKIMDDIGGDCIELEIGILRRYKNGDKCEWKVEL